jgi:hypothetical protein
MVAAIDYIRAEPSNVPAGVLIDASKVGVVQVDARVKHRNANANACGPRVWHHQLTTYSIHPFGAPLKGKRKSGIR